MIWIPILTTLLLASAPSDKPARAVGYVPSGSPVDLHDLGRLARLRDPGIKVLSFGSHHRTEGNDDGANGTHSKLRVEEGNSVLAELDGPGIIQHIWLARAGGDQPDKLDWRKKRLKIHLDGKPDPALDIPLETLFSGAHPHFPRPLVMEGSEGLVFYVPIAFREGCKVVVEGEDEEAWLYQINMLSLPDGSEIEPFQADPAPETASELERARSFWSEPAAYESKILAELPTAIYKLDGVGNSEHVFILPPGPATIRSIELEPTEATADAWRSARLRLVWDQGAGGEPAVDLPVAFAFGTLADTIPFSSLLVGQRDGTWYNRFPMPYRNQAVLRVNATQPIRGTFQVRFEKGIPDHAGYLRADFREAPTTRPNEVFNWLDERGRGHFAGVLMSSRGQANPPFRLEWVDRFQIDGNEASNSLHRDWSALGGRLDGPVASPSRGFPIHRISEEGAWRAAAYHWRVADPVPFATSIEAGVERGGGNALEANHRASVFWYSNEPKTGLKGR